MAGYALALANEGKMYRPHTVAAIFDKQTKARTAEPVSMREVKLSEKTWDVVREGMRRVVMEPGGTASLARVKGVAAAGKTGTAENPHGKSHSWFIGFAPFEHPRIAIAVLVENSGYGGTYAAPIAGMCMEQYLYGRLIRYDRETVPQEERVAERAPVSPRIIPSRTEGVQ
jgi:penicillin-binding protein 2